MKVYNYIKEKGICRAFQVLYKYKIDRCICFFIKKIMGKNSLKDIIIIESHNDFDCNGGALYEYLIKNKYNKKYKIVWMLKNKCNKKLPYNVETYYIHKPSFKKNIRLCTAKYIFMDNDIFNKINDKQKLIYCTHGPFGLKDSKNYTKLPETIDCVLGMSENMDWYFVDQYNLTRNTEIFHLGYPFQDILLSDSHEEYIKISHNKYDKKIMWMPTFRKGGGINRVDSTQDYPLGVPLIKTMKQFKYLNTKLARNNTLLLIKLHPMQDKKSYSKVSSLSNIIMLDGQEEKKYNINKYRLMNESDALISDYSGAAYEYLLLNRQIGFILEDVDDYKIGFSVDNIQDYLVGERIYSFKEFIRFIDHVILEKDMYLDIRTRLLNKMYNYQENNACENLIRKMMISNSKLKFRDKSE